MVVLTAPPIRDFRVVVTSLQNPTRQLYFVFATLREMVVLVLLGAEDGASVFQP